MKSVSLTREEQRAVWEEVKSVVATDFEGKIEEWDDEPIEGEVLVVLAKAYLGQLEEIPNYEQRLDTVQDGEREG